MSFFFFVLRMVEVVCGFQGYPLLMPWMAEEGREWEG